MKSKKYNIFLRAAVLLPVVFFFINGCSVQKTDVQSASVSTDNQISSDTLIQASEPEQEYSQDYQEWACIEPGCGYVYDPADGVIHHRVYSQVQNLRICRQTGDVLSAMRVKTSL